MPHSATEPLATEYTVLIDTGEIAPWTFTELFADANKNYRPLVVRTERRCLGRHPDSKGDYSLAGFENAVGIERKSMEDCQSTILGWDSLFERNHDQCGRRQRFEQELDNLSKLASAVIVEASLSACIEFMPEHGKKTKEQNQKAFHRSIIAYCQDYRVPWLFCDSRRLAEITCLRFLERFHRKWKEGCRDHGGKFM